ncbi:MAG TPA: septal ring lytic transglycosylase RlpA family protein [Xanthomonadaceae bacterium]|nr:septal ring lytic transglycosylase RlpA family protein [Xanthomonadaceae bacterium]
MRAARATVAIAASLLLAACAGSPKKETPAAGARVDAPAPGPSQPRRSPYAPAQEDPSKRGNYTAGGLYAPGVADSVPDGGLHDVDQIPEPEVEDLPRSRYGNRSPYTVLGKSYRVLDSAEGYHEVGLASYYGNKFHGRRTSNLEVYDMYAFTAAHKTLPLPSFARVTNLANGKSVIVRVNDRGPFHDGRVIDLSFAAAVKLGVYPRGTARVDVRGLTAADMLDADRRMANTDDTAPARGAVETPATSATAQASTPSALDGLVATLPAKTGAATNAPANDAVATLASASTAASPATNTDWRFDMRQDGRTMTADEFDAWMRARRARVATGKPAEVAPRGAPPDAAARPALAATPAPASPVAPATSPEPAPAADAITLQVASFAARANAERALAMVSGAGIAHARLLDANANGRQVWRLRIGPVQPDAVAELGSRLQGLGFGQPQRVRE